jgi:hypothetical protein
MDHHSRVYSLRCFWPHGWESKYEIYPTLTSLQLEDNSDQPRGGRFIIVLMASYTLKAQRESVARQAM